MTPTHGASFADGAAHFLGELNAIHAFREGNVRTQLTFLALIADRAGHKLDLDKLDPAATLETVIKSFKGNERPLALVIRKLIAGDFVSPLSRAGFGFSDWMISGISA